DGGTNYSGNVFSISPGGVFSNVLSFDRNFLDGYSPLGSLVAGANGAFFGVATGGGANGKGALFLLNTNFAATNFLWFDKPSGGYGNHLVSFLYTFAGAPMPTPLVRGADGNYYGTTTDDGAYGNGTVYALILGAPFATPPRPAFRS